jgi:G3E family GTPase
VVVINKIDRVDAARRDEVTAVVKALNPVAEIVYADHGQVPLRQILGTGRFDLERASAMPGWARELKGHHTPETEAYGIEMLCAAQHRAAASLALLHLHGPALPRSDPRQRLRLAGQSAAMGGERLCCTKQAPWAGSLVA